MCHIEFTTTYSYVIENLKMAKKEQSSELGTFIYVHFYVYFKPSLISKQSF